MDRGPVQQQTAGCCCLDRRLGPFKAPLPLQSPKPVRRRTCIIESTFQYLFSPLLLWVAITVYIICLSVLPGSCSLLAEWFEEGREELLTLYCHLRSQPGCLVVRGDSGP